MLKKVNFITSTLPPSFGGRTASLLKRARIFSEHGLKTTIYTTNYNQEYAEVYRSYLETKK